MPARGVNCSANVRCLSGVCSAFVRAILKSAFARRGVNPWAAQFQDILDSLPEKPARSRLEPYRDLIEELRRRGRTFREIAHILAEKCHVETAASTIHDFVRVRSCREQRSSRRPWKDATKSIGATTPQLAGAAKLVGETGAAVDEVRRKIAALKVRKSVNELTPEGFQFDPNEPLRLKKPGKK